MKVFSSFDDYGYEDERLYSVLMNEDEICLFSEIQKEFNVKAIVNNSIKSIKQSLFPQIKRNIKPKQAIDKFAKVQPIKTKKFINPPLGKPSIIEYNAKHLPEGVSPSKALKKAGSLKGISRDINYKTAGGGKDLLQYKTTDQGMKSYQQYRKDKAGLMREIKKYGV